MSSPMENRLIYNLLFPFYGVTPELRRLLRPENTLERLIITKALLFVYKYIEVNHPDLSYYSAVANISPGLYSITLNDSLDDNVTELLDAYARPEIDTALEKLLTDGPFPRGDPEMLKLMFEAHATMNDDD